MITPDNFPAVISAFAWPIVVLLIIIIFRSQITALFQRVQSAKLPGGTEANFVEYGKAPGKGENKETQKIELSQLISNTYTSNIKWGNTGNVFWLGHDLMWTVDAILRGAPQKDIVRGLTQAHHHMKSMNMPDRWVESLLQLRIEAQSMPENLWSANKRVEFANKVYSLVGVVGTILESNQPSYKPNP